MKKIISIILAAIALASVMMVSGCGASPLKLGMGVYTAYGEAKNAEGEVNGYQEIAQTLAAVLLDKDGKVVKCEIDSADFKLEHTAEGKAVALAEVKTKYELGKDYGIVAYGGAKKEWFEQIDILEAAIVGKTLDEIKALVVEGYKPNEEVATAGCTIAIADYIKAVEKAINNAKDSSATKDSVLNLGIVVSAGESHDATADANGVLEAESAFCAAALDADNKVVASVSDALAVSASFDTKGVVSDDTKKDTTTKLEAGANYGMVAYGNAKKEWFEQAAIFDAECIGKTADEISALVVNGKGNSDIQSAGCTIYITDMAKAAQKAATVK